MTNFECCKGKIFPSSYYICINCFKVYHKSCVMKNKTNFVFKEGFKLNCCKNTDLNNSQDLVLEKTILEANIHELTENSQMHERHWKKIKAEHDKFLEEATQREEELTDYIRKQDDEIKKFSEEIKKLQLHILDSTNKTYDTQGTQTKIDIRVDTGAQTNDFHDDYNYSTYTTKQFDNQKNNCNQPSTDEPTHGVSKILLVAGKHGKDMSNYLINYLGTCSVSSILKPYANNSHLAEAAVNNTKNFTKQDAVIFWPNDSSTVTYNDLKFRLQYTNFIFLSSPYRYDKPIINEKIYFDNLALNKLIFSSIGNLLQVINVNAILRKSNYHPGGYNIRKVGKKYVALQVANRLKEYLFSDTQQPQVLGIIQEQSITNAMDMGNRTQTQVIADKTTEIMKSAANNSGITNFLYPRLSQLHQQE